MRRLLPVLLTLLLMVFPSITLADTYVFFPYYPGLEGEAEISFPGFKAKDDGGFEFNWRALTDSEATYTEYEHLLKGMHCYLISIDESLNPDDGFTYPSSGYAEYTFSAPFEDDNPDSAVFYATALGYNIRPMDLVLFSFSCSGLNDLHNRF